MKINSQLKYKENFFIMMGTFDKNKILWQMTVVNIDSFLITEKNTSSPRECYSRGTSQPTNPSR